VGSKNVRAFSRPPHPAHDKEQGPVQEESSRPSELQDIFLSVPLQRSEESAGLQPDIEIDGNNQVDDGTEHDVDTSPGARSRSKAMYKEGNLGDVESSRSRSRSSDFSSGALGHQGLSDVTSLEGSTSQQGTVGVSGAVEKVDLSEAGEAPPQAMATTASWGATQSVQSMDSAEWQSSSGSPLSGQVPVMTCQRSFSESEDTALAESACTDASMGSPEERSAKAGPQGSQMPFTSEIWSPRAIPGSSRRGRSREKSPDAAAEEEKAFISSPKSRPSKALSNTEPLDSPRTGRHRSDAPSLADSNFALEQPLAEPVAEKDVGLPSAQQTEEARLARPRPHFDEHVDFVPGPLAAVEPPGRGTLEVQLSSEPHGGKQLLDEDRPRAFTVGGEPLTLEPAEPVRGMAATASAWTTPTARMSQAERRHQTMPASTRSSQAQAPVRHASLVPRASALRTGSGTGSSRSGQGSQGHTSTKVLRVELPQRRAGSGTRQANTSRDTSRSGLTGASSNRARSSGSTPTVVKGTIVSHAGAKGNGAQTRARTAETRQPRPVQVRGRRPGAATSQFYDEAMDCLRLQAGQLDADSDRIDD